MPELLAIAALVVAAGFLSFLLIAPIVKQKKRRPNEFGVGKCDHGFPEYLYCAECEEAKWRKS